MISHYITPSRCYVRRRPLSNVLLTSAMQHSYTTDGLHLNANYKSIIYNNKH